MEAVGWDAGMPGSWEAGHPFRRRKPGAPCSTGRAGSGLLHRVALPLSKPGRRMPDRATHGGGLSNRISANAVGCRSYFLRGRVPSAPHIQLRPRRKGDAGAPGGSARRPGINVSDLRGAITRRRFHGRNVRVQGPLVSSSGGLEGKPGYSRARITQQIPVRRACIWFSYQYS